MLSSSIFGKQPRYKGHYLALFERARLIFVKGLEHRLEHRFRKIASYIFEDVFHELPGLVHV